ncbi:hypothetical protein M9H77_07799 [Catharanthus roseus]|uniref:Uncharacterized protein n=1 Tax=Catharanthus roseus TaxID=4058 RepID=A0ACC0BVY9_CATRO|nr:hypothetical protein M9H77_07799 [Catharanthus roseus]
MLGVRIGSTRLVHWKKNRSAVENPTYRIRSRIEASLFYWAASIMLILVLMAFMNFTTSSSKFAFSSRGFLIESALWTPAGFGLDLCPPGCGPIGLRTHCTTLCGGVGRLLESQERLETEVGPRAYLSGCLEIERSYGVWLVLTMTCRNLVSMTLLCYGIRTLSVEPDCCVTCSFEFGVEAALMCLDSLRLPSSARNPHVGSSISVVKETKGKKSVFL